MMMMMKEIGLYRRKGVGKGVVRRTKNVKKMRVCVCMSVTEKETDDVIGHEGEVRIV